MGTYGVRVRMPPDLPGLYWDEERNRYFRIAEGGNSANVVKYNAREVTKKKFLKSMQEEKESRGRNHSNLYYTHSDLMKNPDRLEYINSPFYLMNNHYGMKSFYQSVKLQQLKESTAIYEYFRNRGWIYYDSMSEQLFYNSVSYRGPSLFASMPYSSTQLTDERVIDQMPSGGNYHNFAILPSGDVRLIKTQNYFHRNSFKTYAGEKVFDDCFKGASIDPAGAAFTINLNDDKFIRKYSFDHPSVVAKLNFSEGDVSLLEYADSTVVRVASNNGKIYTWDQRGKRVDFCLSVNECPRQIAARDSTLIVSGASQELKSFDLRYLKGGRGREISTPLVDFHGHYGGAGSKGQFQLSPCGNFFAIRNTLGMEVKIYDISLPDPLALNRSIKTNADFCDFPPFTWINSNTLVVITEASTLTWWSTSPQEEDLK